MFLNFVDPMGTGSAVDNLGTNSYVQRSSSVISFFRLWLAAGLLNQSNWTFSTHQASLIKLVLPH